jgi:outer membrane protein assembly factor BamB
MTRFASRWTRRPWVAGVLTAALLFACGGECRAQLTSGLVPRHLALNNGLERAWFARAEIDPSRTGDLKCILDGDTLFLLTTAGLVQAMDANTGQTLWVTHVGKPDYPNLGPAANARYVAAMNGSTLYLLDRASGGIKSARDIDVGAPGGGPALGEHHVFTPLMNGRIEAYSLDGPKNLPWFYQSYGRLRSSPRVTNESVVWGTDKGYLYVARLDPLAIHFRVEASGEFEAAPAFKSPLIFGVTVDGDCFAVDEQTGRLRWKYTTGFPVERGPAVVDDRLYLSSIEPSLHAVNVKTGLIDWEAPGITQFAAASKSHVYGIDRFGTIHVLDRTSGAPLGEIPTGGTVRALVNDQTDRLFLVSDTGLIQCLHEVGAKQPTYYVDKPATAESTPPPAESEDYRGDGQPSATETEAPATEDPFTAEPAAETTEDPFGTPVEGEAESPFGPPPEETAPAPAADSGANDDNPFE